MPVRLEQMKKQRVSVAKVKSLILTYAFVREIRFQLQVRGNKRLDWTMQAASDALRVAVSVYGKDLMERYTRTSLSSDGITIDAILPNPNQGLFLLEVLT
jgi:DNA mismatch repair ATPase MutL